MKKSIDILALTLGGLGLLSSCKGQEPEKRLNILIAISDDQSFEHTGFAGCPFIHTPGFDRVAREGVFFENCMAGSPGSAPSRSVLVTGRHHWQNEQSGQHGSSWMKKHIPMVDMFEAAGYHTGGTGKGVGPFRYAKTPEDSLFRKTDAAGRLYNKIGFTPENDNRPAKNIAGTDYYANFLQFMKERKEGEPFYFWYSSHEPHRKFEKGSWKRNGKKLEDVKVPGFLPDHEEVRGDLLDYGLKIEWFDAHLVKMLDYLDSIGELDNTIVIVTGDNGMPFPRAKALCYEYGIHVPMAISCPGLFPAGRKVEDPVSFADIAPTLFELTGVSFEGMLPMSGKSIAHILKSGKSGVVDPDKKYVFTGRERHGSARWQNLGYPQRAIRSKDFLYIWNMRPERWPAGPGQVLINGKPGPMYGIDKDGRFHEGWAFCDGDGGPSKAYIIEHKDDPQVGYFFDIAFSKHKEFELFDIRTDPYCLHDLSEDPAYKEVKDEMHGALVKELQRSGDPRLGDDPEIFDTYKRYMGIRRFPKPDWAKK